MIRIIIYVAMAFYCRMAFGQYDMGTIKVNTKNTVSVMFAAPIDFVVVGNDQFDTETGAGEKYQLKTNGNAFFIQALVEGLERTSITVRLKDGEIDYGFIEYDRSSDKLFYDYREIGANAKTSAARKLDKEKNDSLSAIRDEYERKLDFVMSQPVEYKDFGIVSSKIQFSVTNIMNDSKNMYVKLVINNTSGNAFEVSSVVFKFTEGKTKGLKKNEVQNEERLMPLLEKMTNMVKAYTAEQFGFVLPLFSTGEKGRFIVQFIEQNGTRNYQIVLKAKDMLKIKNF